MIDKSSVLFTCRWYHGISLGEKQRLFYRISGEATDRFSSGAARATLENSQSLLCEYIIRILLLLV